MTFQRLTQQQLQPTCSASPAPNATISLPGGILFVDISTPRLPGARLLIDSADWVWLNQQKIGRIFAQQNPRSLRVTAAAHTTGNGKTVLIHRLLMTGPGEIHAVDGDLLDLRRCNLQLKNRSQRLWGMRKRNGLTSRYKGVCKLSRERQWRAQIGMGNRRIFLGFFDDEVSAARRYDQEAILLHGETARLNFSPPAQPPVACAVGGGRK